MKITIQNKRWRMWILEFFIFANLIDAAGTLGLKYLSAVLLVLLLLGKRYIKYEYIECFLFGLCPILLVVYACVWSKVSIGSAISTVTFCMALLFSFAIYNEKIEMEEIATYFLRIMCFFSVIIICIFIVAYALLMVGQPVLYWRIGGVMQNKFQMGFFGYAKMGSLMLPIVYFRCSMFLIFALAIACYYRNKKAMVVILIANMMVSTTANIIFSLAVIICYLFSTATSKKFKTFLGIVGGCGLLGVIICGFSIIYNKFGTYIDDLTMQSESSQIKLGHITSIFREMFSSVRYFVFGMGGGASFYSTGREAELTSCEVSQLECWRRFGTIYTLIFFVYIFYVICRMYRLGKSYKMISIGLLLFFMATASNPQLMSPMFLTIMFMCNKWQKEVRGKLKRRDNNDISNYTSLQSTRYYHKSC